MVSIPEPRQNGNSFGLSAWRGRSTVMVAPHAHNDIEINYSRSELTYDSGGRTTVLPAGVPSIFWGARPHQLVEYDDSQPLAFATIPLEDFMSWGVPDATHERLLQGQVLVGVEDDGDVTSGLFERWAADLHRGGALRRRAAALEIQALVLRSSSGSWAELRSGSPRSSRDLSRAARMATFIDVNSSRDIRVSDVAAVVHLHPNRAAEIFRSVFGASITSYLRAHRVAEAQRLLLTTKKDSGAISTAAGFRSLSSYHDAFVAVCGLPPQRWRRRQLNEASAPGVREGGGA